MRKALASLPYVLVTEGSSVREIILPKPNQGGRKPHHSRDLSSGSVIPGGTTRGNQAKVNLSKNTMLIPVAFQGTCLSLCLLYPGEAFYL